MEGWAVTLPFPPTENRFRGMRAVFSKKHRRAIAMVYETEEAKEYKKTVAKLMLVIGGPFPKFPRGDVNVQARVYRPRRTGDTTNRIKVLEDALKGYAWTDDAQVKKFSIERFEDPDNPRAEVEVFPVEATQRTLVEVTAMPPREGGDLA